MFFTQLVCLISRPFLKHLLSSSFRHLFLLLVCFQHVHLNGEHIGSPCSENHSLVCSMVFTNALWPYPDCIGGEKIWVYATPAHHCIPTVGKFRTSARQGGPVPSSRSPDLEGKGTWYTVEHTCPWLLVKITWNTYGLDYRWWTFI